MSKNRKKKSPIYILRKIIYFKHAYPSNDRITEVEFMLFLLDELLQISSEIMTPLKENRKLTNSYKNCYILRMIGKTLGLIFDIMISRQ